MAKGDPVPDDELVIRRFNPADSRHYWFNQGNDGPMRIKSGCLNYNEDGFSVYQDSVLERAGLERIAVLEVQTWRLAGLTAREVREIARGADQLFDVIEDPYPDGEAGALARDVAHALITLPATTSTKSIDKWATALARNLRSVDLFRTE